MPSTIGMTRSSTTRSTECVAGGEGLVGGGGGMDFPGFAGEDGAQFGEGFDEARLSSTKRTW